MFAVPYLRFSSIEQASGSSLERQEALVSGWLALHPEYTRYEQKFEDLGLSAFSGHHITQGDMGRLLDAIEQGFIPAGSVVLVEALDRFSRLKPMAALRNLEEIVSKGIEVITLEDGQRYDASALGDQRLLYLVMKAQAAHEYSARLSTRVLGSYASRTAAAKAGGQIKRRNPFWLTSEGRLIPEKALVLQQAYLSFSSGTPLRLLVTQFPEHFGNRQSLKHALKNPAAIGHWQREHIVTEEGKRRRVKGELIRDVFEAAIPEELYFQVQKLLADQSDPAHTVARKFPLAGLLVCGSCGANMVLLKGGRGQTNTVRCSKRMANTASCTNQKTIPVPVVGWFFYETMKPFAFRAYQRTKLPETQRQRIKLEGQIDQLRQQQARLRRLVLLDEDDVDAQADYQNLVHQRQSLEQELSALPTTLDVEEVPAQEFYRFLRGDPFAITNLLQLAGYRIICNQTGELVVSPDDLVSTITAAQYVGYQRRSGLWEIRLPDGNSVHVDKHAN